MVFSAKFSEKRNKMADASQQNTESSEEADESQKTPVFVKRFQEAETVIKRFELETVAKFASWKTDKAFGKGISSCSCQLHTFLIRNLGRPQTQYCLYSFW